MKPYCHQPIFHSSIKPVLRGFLPLLTFAIFCTQGFSQTKRAGIIIDTATNRVTFVGKTSPGEKAGIQKGDIITMVNGETAANKNAVRLIAAAPDVFSLEYSRAGVVKTTKLTKQLMESFTYKCLNGNCINGTGTYIYENMSYYTGSFEEGKPNGKGSMYYNNGSTYVGEWSNGDYYGDGVITYANGKTLSGYFVFGDPYNVKGNFYSKDGYWWEGSIEKGRKHGKFSIWYANGNYWKGEYKEGKPVGEILELLADKKLAWYYTMSGDEKIWHKLSRYENGIVSDKYLVEENVTYNPTTKTWKSGFFLDPNFKKGTDSYVAEMEISSYDDYVRNIKQRGTATTSTNSNGTSSTNTSGSKKGEAIRAYKLLTEYMTTTNALRNDAIRNCNNDMENKYGNSSSCKQAKRYLDEVLAKCNEFVSKYKNHISKEDMDALQRNMDKFLSSRSKLTRVGY